MIKQSLQCLEINVQENSKIENKFKSLYDSVINSKTVWYVKSRLYYFVQKKELNNQKNFAFTLKS